ncbi:MAG: TspO/MBR family protein [Anaerovoracaceae bacterium]
MKIRWKTLIFNLAVPLITGAVSGFLTRSAMQQYGQLNQPPLSPPSAVFPVVWTTLFLLMGISAYLVTMKRSDGLKSFDLPAVYWIQLIVNFIWPLIFFNLAIYGIALAWLILLIILVIYMIFQFHDITPAAGWLQVPYLLWLIFAGYLNAGIWLLN